MMKQPDGPTPETIEEIRSRARSLGARRGLAANRARGLPTGCAPVGFRNRRDAEGRPYVEPDPVLAPLVAEAFRLRARGMPIRKILAELTPKGLVSRNGKPMGPSGLLAVLRNPTYRTLPAQDNGTAAPAHETN
jgi:hypothetical protein